MGFIRKNSTISLISGWSLGSLYAYSAYRIRENWEWGLEGAIAASLLLMLAMGPRALRLKKRIPIIASCLGAAAFCYYTKRWADFYM